MKPLKFGCSYSELWASPSNWRTTTAKSSLKKTWYVQCLFYDPAFKDKFPKGYPVRKKCNRGDTIDERRALIRYYLDELPRIFEEQGYNPISGLFMIDRIPDFEDEPEPGELHKNLSICDALIIAKDKISGGDNYKSEVRIAVNRFNLAAAKLHKEYILVSELTYGQLNDIFAFMKLSPNYYNKFRAYFIALFKLMKKYGCCNSNLAMDLDRQVQISKPREVLEIEKLKMILRHLQDTNYNFYRYAQIFFYSGTRSTELFSIQAKNVRVDAQEYDVIVKKGRQYVWETKIILINALPFWKELVAETKRSDDFLFSHHLSPGHVQIDSKQITRRWRRLVKLQLAFYDGSLWKISDLKKDHINVYERITADFYSMKHNFLDLLDDQQTSNALVSADVLQLINGLDVDDNTKALLMSKLSSSPEFDIAQKMAAHRSIGMTNKVYKIGKSKRENALLKNLTISV